MTATFEGLVSTNAADVRRRLVVERGRIAAERDNLVIEREEIATALRRPIGPSKARPTEGREANPRAWERLNAERNARLEELKLLAQRRRELAAQRDRLVRDRAKMVASRDRLMALRQVPLKAPEAFR